MTRSRHYRALLDSDPEDADDERSFSEIDEEDLNYRRAHGTLRRESSHCTPRFPGQDVRPTSQKELAGWYSYAWAAEAFVICGVGSFIPVTLEQLARENGVLLSDRSIPCGASDASVSLPPDGREEDSGQCVVYIAGWPVNTASFAMYTFSLSVLLQALIIISMSAAADHGNYRKRLLLMFGFMGSVATMMFITVVPRFFIVSAAWAVIGNVGFGASFVLLNAFLPVLVRHHPSLLFTSPPPTPHQHGRQSLFGQNHETHYTSIPIPRNPASKELILSSKISSYGIAIGYCGAVLMQIFSIALVLSTGSTTWSLQLVLLSVGMWWFIFMIPTILWMRPRPGPPLPKIDANGVLVSADVNGFGNSHNPGAHTQQDVGWWAYIAYAWKSLWKTIMRARRLKDVMLFLAAWFMISDGVATVSGTAILFAKTNLHMKPAAVALISVISTLFGVLGAFSWSKFSPHFGISPSRTILFLIFVFLLIPLYGLLGFIPAIQKTGFLGLTSPFEMYVLGAIYGFVLGGISGYCRSVFGELVPPGSEAAFFALYAITDKGSSIFGPAIVGVLTDAYGNIRAGFWFLAVLLTIPLPLVAMVDVDRGKREAWKLAEEEMRSLGIIPVNEEDDVDEPSGHHDRYLGTQHTTHLNRENRDSSSH